MEEHVQRATFNAQRSTSNASPSRRRTSNTECAKTATGSGGGKAGGPLGNSPCGVGCISATIDDMNAAVETNKLYEAQTEILHLKNTIQALRDELEAMRVGKNETVQAAIAAGANEARQLQATIAALRTELEQKVFQHADDLERQKHFANDELRLLRQTIAALREELEIGIRGQKSEDSGQRREK